MKHFKGFLGVLLTVSGVVFLSGEPAFARDLHGRLGLGYNAQFANYRESGSQVPGVALKYAFTKDLAIEGVVGVATTKPGNSVIGLKFFKNIFFETNLNFYFMAAGGLVTANHKSGADFQSGFGAEFFIPGLESIGISMEVGGQLTNITGSFVFRTLGASFLHAGMRFYF